MTATRNYSETPRNPTLRVDLIDDQHADWEKVLAALDRSYLMLEGEWLSARQSVLVARRGEEFAGHLAFHIEPTCDLREDSSAVDAELDLLDVNPGFCEGEVKQALLNAAVARAAMLRCQRLIGFGPM